MGDHTKEFEGTAKLFMNGRSQAVRLPRECRFEGSEVRIEKRGEQIVLSPIAKSWDSFFLETEKGSLPPREQPDAQQRRNPLR